MKDLVYFGLISSTKLDFHKHGIGTTIWGVNDLYLVKFRVKDLIDPNVEPIGMFPYNGMNRYLWDDKFFAEFDLPFQSIIAALRCKQHLFPAETDSFIKLISDYQNSDGPIIASDHTLSTSPDADLQFCRVLYEVKN